MVRRYFFNVSGGYTFTDEEGTELNSLRQARIEAVRFAGQILFDEPDRLLSSQDWIITVRCDGRDVFRLRVGADTLASPDNES